MNDQDLLATYNSGFNTSHLAGLKAVWAAAEAELKKAPIPMVPKAPAPAAPAPKKAGKWV